MSDRNCPACNYDGDEITAEALRQELGAGYEIACPRCKATLLIQEHSNGWQDWMTFEAVDTDGAENE